METKELITQKKEELQRLKQQHLDEKKQKIASEKQARADKKAKRKLVETTVRAILEECYKFNKLKVEDQEQDHILERITLLANGVPGDEVVVEEHTLTE